MNPAQHRGPGPTLSQRPMITVDVEDWAQSTWDSRLPMTLHAARNTEHVLEVLERLGIRATFFILGLFAEAFPALVKEIQAAGHELASHGHGHIPITQQTPAEFRADVLRAKADLEALLGQPVEGYRAPDFSIVQLPGHNTLWALDILAEEGFLWDSSIFPIQGRRYGVAQWPLSPFKVKLSSDRHLIELPIATLDPLGLDRPGALRWLEALLPSRGIGPRGEPEPNRRLPVGGGGYFRLLPGRLSRVLAAHILKARPYVFYCHPYEFAPHELKAMALPRTVRLHQGLGRGAFEARFCGFVEALGGQPVRDFLAAQSLETLRMGTVSTMHASPGA